MEKLECNRCGAGRETTDNFCRSCGHQFTVNLPSVRSSNLPARTGATLPPSLVGSVAVLALGTGLEWLARRMAGSAAKAAGRALISTDRTPAITPAEPDDVTVQEVLYVRKVHLRR
ncbi:MAG TPA: hypothetical protein VFX19_08410 [Dehalococcoidia bacterium]|nr:hypothetical protein [Dehalococcoidia bacterium]